MPESLSRSASPFAGSTAFVGPACARSNRVTPRLEACDCSVCRSSIGTPPYPAPACCAVDLQGHGQFWQRVRHRHPRGKRRALVMRIHARARAEACSTGTFESFAKSSAAAPVDAFLLCPGSEREAQSIGPICTIFSRANGNESLHSETSLK